MYVGLAYTTTRNLVTTRRGESIGICCYDGVAAAVTTLHVPMGALFGTYIPNDLTQDT